MKKWNEIKDKPITVGYYWKMCAWSVAITAIFGVVYFTVLYFQDLKSQIKRLTDRLKAAHRGA